MKILKTLFSKQDNFDSIKPNQFEVVATAVLDTASRNARITYESAIRHAEFKDKLNQAAWLKAFEIGSVTEATLQLITHRTEDNYESVMGVYVAILNEALRKGYSEAELEGCQLFIQNILRGRFKSFEAAGLYVLTQSSVAELNQRDFSMAVQLGRIIGDSMLASLKSGMKKAS